jgi:MFS family permease
VVFAVKAIGAAIGAWLFGVASDKFGRRRCLLFAMCAEAISVLVCYCVRSSFLYFCVARFSVGLFDVCLSLGLAYVSDAFANHPTEAVNQMNILTGLRFVGQAVGATLPILLHSYGLFAPLLFAATLVTLATVPPCIFVSQITQTQSIRSRRCKMKSINQNLAKLFTQYCVVPFFDNFGSEALKVLAMAVMYTKWCDTSNVISDNVFRAFHIGFILCIFPAVAIAGPAFKKLGLPKSAMAGNLLTASVCVVLLYASKRAASLSSFAIYVTLLITGFPFTVMSQLTTSPTIDVVTCPKCRGVNHRACLFLLYS